MVSFRGFLKWLSYRKREQELQSFAIGMNSTVDGPADKHVILLDFDIQDQEAVEAAIVETQQFWALSDICLYKTKHGFHAIGFFDHVPYSRLKMIIDYTSLVDDMFRYISRFYRHKTIRVAGKYKERDIKFVKVIRGVREPNAQELEIGLLKMREHALMSGHGVGWGICGR